MYLVKDSEPWLLADPEVAARIITKLAKAVHTIQDGRIYIDEIKGPFVSRLNGTHAEYEAGLIHACSNGWLDLHESGAFVRLTKAGRDL